MAQIPVSLSSIRSVRRISILVAMTKHDLNDKHERYDTRTSGGRIERVNGRDKDCGEAAARYKDIREAGYLVLPMSSTGR